METILFILLIIALYGCGYLFIQLEMKDSRTQKEMVKFGTYLLSQKRRLRISEQNKNKVTDADLSNYKDYNE